MEMNSKEDLYNSLKEAYKNQDKNVIQALKNVIASFTNLEKSMKDMGIIADAIVSIIEKEVKKYDEQIYYLEKSNKKDKDQEILQYTYQKDFLAKFIPEKMSVNDLINYLSALFESEAIEKDIKNKGLIFKQAKKDLGNTFNGADLNTALNEVFK